MKQLVIGILAHVDSGKTTLTEGMLYRSGNIKKLGRVDHGDAFLDSYTLERDRGITIFSKQAILRMEEAEFTLLDTPGHIDFSTEMERTLQVLDYAILVISGTDGVQSHTQTLWRLLKRHHIPTFIFVNKMDLAGSDQSTLMQKLKHRLSDRCIDFSQDKQSEEFAESLAMCDEALLNQFLESGALEDCAIISSISQSKVFPCYFGSALKLSGVDNFLLGLKKYTHNTICYDTFGAKVFKIARDDQGNRLTYLKVTGGTLKVKALLTGHSKDSGNSRDNKDSGDSGNSRDNKDSGDSGNSRDNKDSGDSGNSRDNKEWFEKVNQIRIYSGVKFQSIEEALPGMICAVTGLTQTYPGEGLGVESDSEVPLLEPVLTYRVGLQPENDARLAISKLRILEEEDPQLHVMWNEQLQEIHMQIMGEVQLEVLKSLIWERFQMDVYFGQGNIVYRETIEAEVEGVGHFEPLRHYAEVHLLLTPLERGSGIFFKTSCSEDTLDKNWQRLVLTHLEEKLHLGVLTGSPITDISITLVAGRANIKHTEGGDFRQATYRAVRQGLKQAKSVLLEPWYDFQLEVPPETVGRAMSDLQRMNGNFAPPELTQENMSVLTGSVPVASMRDYQIQVTNYTRGKGRLSCTLKGYLPCHNTEEIVADIGYDSESDIENSADSVFCSHGAGFLVKWDHVQKYMHIGNTTLQKSKEQEQKPEEKQVAAKRTADYCATLASDKELMSIYERTYGPIKRDPRSFFRSTHKKNTQETSTNIVSKPLPGPEYLLVDGYNIIFAWDDLSAIAKKSLDAARNRLINILCNYQGFCQCEVILVFDAYKLRGNIGEVEKFHNISVVYTKEAETADMYIEKVTHKLGRTFRVRVATSDGLEQLIILSHGAISVSAMGFREEVDQVEKEIRSFLEQ